MVLVESYMLLKSPSNNDSNFFFNIKRRSRFVRNSRGLHCQFDSRDCKQGQRGRQRDRTASGKTQKVHAHAWRGTG